MKARMSWKKIISLLLSIALMLQMIPGVAFAASADHKPSVYEYKGMTMVNLANGEWVARWQYNTGENWFFPNPIDLRPGHSLLRLTYAIERGQEVDLELYRLKPGEVDMKEHSWQGVPWYTTVMKPDKTPSDPDNDPTATKLEEFLGEYLGHLNAVVIKDNITLTGSDSPEAVPKKLYPSDWEGIIAREWQDGQLPNKVKTEGIYGYGWKGVKMVVPAEATLLDTDEPMEAAPPALDMEPAEAVGPADNSQPAEGTQLADNSQPAEGTQPTENALPAENNDPVGEAESGEGVASAEPGDTEAAVPDPAESADVPTGEEGNDPAPENSQEPDAGEPTEPPVEETPSPEVDNSAIWAEMEYVAAQMEPVSTLDAFDPDSLIQNYLLWDGSVIKDGSVSVPDYTDGFYVIVMTPCTPSSSKYNNFLGFEVNHAAENQEYNSYNEPKMTAEEYAKFIDPVDLITGSFSWEYTDFSLYGKNDLPFTRYYESIHGNRNVGLGYGWTSNYTAELDVQALFASVTLPKGQQLYFDLEPDGSYQPAGDYTLTYNGGYILANEYEGITYNFDSACQLQSISHRDGNTISFGWSGGKVTSISNQTGSYTLAYNGDGNLASVTDSVGRSITLTYEDGYLVSVENPDGDSLRYTYTPEGYLASVQNFRGEVYVSNTYDGKGRVTHQYAANMGTFDITYDDEARHNVITVAEDGSTMGVWYDRQGRLLRRDDAAGSMTFAWNDQSQLVSQTDRNGNTTRYEHDAAGNVSKVTYPDGTSESYVYDGNRMVTSYTDRNGVTASYTYDSTGHRTSATDGRGNTTTYAYDAQGNLTSVTDREGSETTYSYDSMGNRLTMTDAKGNVTHYTYDAQGRLTQTKDAQGNTTAYEYTTAGKLVKITDAQGNVQTYTVDGNGFNTSESDWLGNVTTYERNTQNQITKVTDPLGNTTTYTYDERGNRVTSTDANGNTTTYGYDAAGRMISMTDAGGNT